MSQNSPLNDFKGVEDISEFDESFSKSYNEGSDEGYFFKVDVQYQEKMYDLRNDLLLLSKRMKTEKCGKLVANL